MGMSTADFHAEVKAKRLSAMGLSAEVIEGKLGERAAAREAKDWARADAVRDELEGLGIAVMDTAAGQEWRVRLQGAEG
jgi:cysteinyl-tRNA synthetase